LLSASTLETSRVRVAGGKSLSDVLEPEPPTSEEHYLTPRMVMGLVRRMQRRRRPLQRVLLRTPRGWRRRTVMCTSRAQMHSSQNSLPLDKKQETTCMTADGYEFSLPRNASASRDSPEVGLLVFLAAAVEQCLETQSRSRSQNSSDD
jgi:hypothetical protein